MPTKTKTKNTKLNISQEDELKILRRIVDLTCSDLDLSPILKEVVKIVNEMTGADSVFIYLFGENKRDLILKASKTPHKKELGKVILKVGEGITGWVAKENKPVAITKNAYKDKRFKSFDVLPEDKYEAFLSFPIIYKGKAIGVVNVQHRAPHEYSKSTRTLLNTIAKQIGGVLEHAQLYEYTKKKATQFDSLVKVSQSITSEDYLDEILNLIVVVTAEMLNSKICSVMLLDEKKNELVIKATQSLSQDYRKKPNIKVKSSLTGEVVLSRRPLTVDNVQKEEKYSYRDLAKKEHLTSMIAVPMIAKDKVTGVINVYMKEQHNFSQEEVDVLQMVSNQAAVAVHNTNLIKDTLQAKEALESRKVIERAKGVLMRMNNLTEEAAHRMIHKKAMDSCKSMKEVAESVILMDEFRK